MSRRRTADEESMDAEPVALPTEEVTPTLGQPPEEIAASAATLSPTPLPPEKVLPYIPIDVFCATSGIRPDQTRGFVRWAKAQGLTTMTIPAWRACWQKFQTRPVI